MGELGCSSYPANAPAFAPADPHPCPKTTLIIGACSAANEVEVVSGGSCGLLRVGQRLVDPSATRPPPAAARRHPGDHGPQRSGRFRSSVHSLGRRSAALTGPPFEATPDQLSRTRVLRAVQGRAPGVAAGRRLHLHGRRHPAGQKLRQGVHRQLLLVPRQQRRQRPLVLEPATRVPQRRPRPLGHHTERRREGNHTLRCRLPSPLSSFPRTLPCWRRLCPSDCATDHGTARAVYDRQDGPQHCPLP